MAKYRWACFAAGTPIRTASGSKPIEELVPGDRVLSRHEDDVEGAIFEQEVVEVFRRSSWLLRLTIDDRTIDTTPEHPFFVRDRGWTSAGELKAGDQLASLDGDWLSLQHSQILDQDATVYNVSIHDFHTYFVGEEQWGWSVWSHNSTCEITVSKRGVVQVWGEIGGMRIPLMGPTTAAQLEVAAHEASNAGKINLADLRRAISSNAELKGLQIRQAASELPVLRPGTKEWDEAVEALQAPTVRHGTDFRVESYRDAEALLQRGNPNMPFFAKGKTAGWRTYQRGYESHGMEIEPGSSTPWNNLPHIKWRDMTSGRSTKADGHIYFGG